MKRQSKFITTEKLVLTNSSTVGWKNMANFILSERKDIFKCSINSMRQRMKLEHFQKKKLKKDEILEIEDEKENQSSSSSSSSSDSSYFEQNSRCKRALLK